VGIESAAWRIQELIKKNLKIEKVDALPNLAEEIPDDDHRAGMPGKERMTSGTGT
jgi:hypothetical protein